MRRYLSFIAFVGIFSCAEKEGGFNGKNTETFGHPYRTDSIILKPIKFQPEVVSTKIDKYNTSFSPDGNTMYYTVTSQKLGVTGIAFQKFENGRFRRPEFVPFVSADIPMTDVQISPNGDLMLFSTFMDYEGKPEGFNFNIWTSELTNGEWQRPVPMGYPISSTGNEFYPVMINDGSIYFCSDKDGNSDIYKSQLENGQYQQPTKLPDNINSVSREADAFVARDESYIIFVRVDEPDGFGNSDLYISFRINENEWTAPVNMGEEVNSRQIDGSPYVTPDEKYLIFTSNRTSDDIKKRAIKSYGDFETVTSSSDNGSLNFYIVNFNLKKYKNDVFTKN
ncbi:hypothetical protein [uncultured Croceitalea sp.]|uniref:TolB family protein n=1 Tax=uncultured Croceitalea sp. TaxID=1798908 RepID=UPI0033065D40